MILSDNCQSRRWHEKNPSYNTKMALGTLFHCDVINVLFSAASWEIMYLYIMRKTKVQISAVFFSLPRYISK